MIGSLNIIAVSILALFAVVAVLGIVLAVKRKQRAYVLMPVLACVFAVALVFTDGFGMGLREQAIEPSSGWNDSSELPGVPVSYSFADENDGVRVNYLADYADSKPALLTSDQDFIDYAHENMRKSLLDYLSAEERLSSLGKNYFDYYDLLVVPYTTSTVSQTATLLGVSVENDETNVYIQLSHLDPDSMYITMIGGGVYYLQVEKGVCPSTINIVWQNS